MAAAVSRVERGEGRGGLLGRHRHAGHEQPDKRGQGIPLAQGPEQDRHLLRVWREVGALRVDRLGHALAVEASRPSGGLEMAMSRGSSPVGAGGMGAAAMQPRPYKDGRGESRTLILAGLGPGEREINGLDEGPRSPVAGRTA